MRRSEAEPRFFFGIGCSFSPASSREKTTHTFVPFKFSLPFFFRLKTPQKRRFLMYLLFRPRAAACTFPRTQKTLGAFSKAEPYPFQTVHQGEPNHPLLFACASGKSPVRNMRNQQHGAEPLCISQISFFKVFRGFRGNLFKSPPDASSSHPPRSLFQCIPPPLSEDPCGSAPERRAP